MKCQWGRNNLPQMIYLILYFFCKWFSNTPYAGKKIIKPTSILSTVCEPAISIQFAAMYSLAEPENAVKKNVYVSIILAATVDTAGANHQLFDHFSLICWNT